MKPLTSKCLVFLPFASLGRREDFKYLSPYLCSTGHALNNSFNPDFNFRSGHSFPPKKLGSALINSHNFNAICCQMEKGLNRCSQDMVGWLTVNENLIVWQGFGKKKSKNKFTRGHSIKLRSINTRNFL